LEVGNLGKRIKPGPKSDAKGGNERAPSKEMAKQLEEANSNTSKPNQSRTEENAAKHIWRISQLL
jgi:hypothetical protein